MEYTIYVITNEVNGKEYVGVTCRSVKRRWSNHKSRARNGTKTHLYSAMRKHGVGQFLIQPVERAEIQERAFKLEKQWIADLDTYHGEGYNMTPGGEGTSGKNNPMYGQTAEDYPNLQHAGKDNPMHGRTGEDAPAYGRTGEDCPNSKMSRDEASALKWYACYTTRTQTQIGEMFGVCSGQVSHIKSGKSWPNLDPKPPADNGQLRLPLGAT